MTGSEHLHACSFIQSCLTVCDPMDCSSPGSSVHGISQARILKWVVISSSRGSYGPRDQTCTSWTAGGFFTTRAISEQWYLHTTEWHSSGQSLHHQYIQQCGSQNTMQRERTLTHRSTCCAVLFTWRSRTGELTRVEKIRTGLPLCWERAGKDLEGMLIFFLYRCKDF